MQNYCSVYFYVAMTGYEIYADPLQPGSQTLASSVFREICVPFFGTFILAVISRPFYFFPWWSLPLPQLVSLPLCFPVKWK